MPCGIAALVVIGDAWTKAWARAALVDGPRHVVGPLWWRLSFNAGVSFSLSTSWPTLAATAEIIALLGVVVVMARIRPGAPAVGCGLVVGGGVGNLVDRFVSASHHVTDFISVGNFEIFNVADAAITTGVCVLVLVVVLGRPLLVTR